MKKLLFTMTLFFVFSLWSFAQTIENFESIKMNIFSSGTNGNISVVPNPDPSGINTSGYVAKMVRGFDGDPWAGWYATLPTPIDVTTNMYVHLKIWKPRISPLVFKYEGGNGNSGDVYSIYPQTLVNQWEELVFDMSMVSGEYVQIVFIPDFESPLTLTEDIVLYYDELYANNNPTIGSGVVQVMEDFENIPIHLLLNGPDDQSMMTKVLNPDITGINLSGTVIEFLRDKDGVPWGGFWSDLPEAIDVTTNKYIHVKVWKPRISIIKFKIEGGAAGTIELESMYPQTKTNEWEDIVFDFSEKTGEYPIIAFLPDFVDPVGLSQDITIYFDDLILNNDPNPALPPAQTISVDMTESGMTSGSSVWITGTLGGIYGTWNEPGTNPNNQMLDLDGDGIYSITLSLPPDQLIAFKFFWGFGWSNGDPAPGGDRTLTLTNTMDVLYKWGVDGIVISPSIHWILNMSYQQYLGNFDEATDYVDVAGSFNYWTGVNHHLTPIGNGLYEITVDGFTEGDWLEYKFRINGDWNTSEFPNGGPNRTYIVQEGINEISLWYNDEQFPELDFASDLTLLCEGETATFSILYPNFNIDSVNWNFPGGTPDFSNELSPMVVYPETGNYDVSLIAYGNSGSTTISKEDYIHVQTVPAAPAKPMGETLVCFSEFFSDYTTNTTSPIWVLTPATAGNINYFDNTCRIFWNQSYTGQSSLKVQSFNDCGSGEFSEALLIEKTEQPNINFAEDILVCYGESKFLEPQITGGNPPFLYQWQPFNLFNDFTSATPVITPFETVNILLTLTDNLGCIKTQNILVTVDDENYDLDFSGFPHQFITPPFTVQFDNLTPDLENYNFTWYFGTGDSSVVAEPTYTYTSNGVYSVTLVATSKITGCSDTFVKEGYIECTGAGIDDAFWYGFQYFIDEDNQTLNFVFEKQPDNLLFKIFDLVGKEYITAIISQREYIVALKRLTPGVYFFSIRNEGQVTSKKIIITK